ncbi:MULTISPECIES: hypothetical protein [Lactiplantibacillus]|jgi:hypothetical protein|uniref:DUF302 domain-containing protein n=1 Tax=Lactiplantibacillus pentosus TaxID=1589 RepID=A0AAW8VUI2_LACPE|nr:MULTISPECIES: hypothetical protein [Lactiplantibacillus]AYG38032.1 hypothetical protein CFK27_08960 [Lactiplantibacillus pentosus]AYG40690.1 hypothetical protein CFI14_06115 [Lactiplantibacillus pentosus]MBU7448805.1 hypothetical protein [Lactiplantibacillus sp. 7.2.4]MBU7475056.1 hypothetical protein [Lactiplantibacillus pentosus]MBU7481270.1 hypothetical protein [Lactiplantibacillus pentosus]
MQRNVQTFIDDVTAEKVTQASLTGTYDQLTAQVQPWLAKLVAAVKQDQLAQITLTTTHEPAISFRLETSVINLPLANLTEIGKVTVADDTMPINVYMIAESEALQSGLRIDELGSVDDVLSDQANAEKLLTDWLSAQVDRLDQITAVED